MDNVKNDRYYLDKIIFDLKFIIEHTSGKNKSEIEEDEVLLDSIMFRIIQIAENNNKLTSEFKEKHNAIPWLAIKGMRNRIVHEYGEMNISIVYDVVKNGIPDMYAKLTKI